MPHVSSDGRYLFLMTFRDTSRKMRLWVSDLHALPKRREDGGREVVDLSGGEASLNWTKVADDFEAGFEAVDNDGTRIIIRTNQDAPRMKGKPRVPRITEIR